MNIEPVRTQNQNAQSPAKDTVRMDSAENESYADILHKASAEIAEKVISGKTQQSFQFGAQSFTLKEWDKLITRTDDSINDVKDAIKEREDQQKKKEN
ncbi:MAG: hypothetical protein LKF52_02790 [Butyrivibrio sp.]|jgi:hypothetical protein|nr:hypothetical protein [Butyrivibrio sp.]